MKICNSNPYIQVSMEYEFGYGDSLFYNIKCFLSFSSPPFTNHVSSTNFIETILEEDASIGIVTYDSSAYRASGFSVNKRSLESMVSSIRNGGGTNIEAGLKEADSMLTSSNAKKKINVFMSDGSSNEGKEGDELVAYADKIKDSGVLIYTLGFFESMFVKAVK